MIRRRPGAARGDLGHLLGELALVWRPPRERSRAAVGAQGSPRGGQRGAGWLRNRPTEHGGATGRRAGAPRSTARRNRQRPAEGGGG